MVMSLFNISIANYEFWRECARSNDALSKYMMFLFAISSVSTVGLIQEPLNNTKSFSSLLSSVSNKWALWRLKPQTNNILSVKILIFENGSGFLKLLKNPEREQRKISLGRGQIEECYRQTCKSNWTSYRQIGQQNSTICWQFYQQD